MRLKAVPKIRAKRIKLKDLKKTNQIDDECCFL